jgi:hypothetical protein
MFFDEIKVVETSIKQIKTDLVKIGEGVEGHYDQLDDFAAHIIAIEAVLTEVIKKVDVDAVAIKTWIVDATKDSTGQEGGSEKARIIVDNLLVGDPVPERKD